MATVMGFGHSPHGYGSPNLNRAAVAAAAHSVQAHRVYVGNLPYAVGWRELKDFMREAGDVSFAEVLMGPDGRSKGCGVVEFATGEGAQKAIAELSDRPLFGRPVFIRGRLCQIETPLDRETQPRYGHHPQKPTYHNNSHGGNFGGPKQLFVSGLALTVTWRTLKDMFRQAGNVVRVDVTAGKGVGTVMMSTEAEATAAIATFNGSTIEGSRIVVREDRFANNNQHGGPPHNHNFHQGHGYGSNQGNFNSAPRGQSGGDPANQQPSTQVFINNLPYSTDSTGLLAMCPSGATNCEVLSSGGRSKGMGIVEFSSLEAAAEALGALSSQVIAGRPLMAKYNERWHEFSEQAASRPL